MLSAKTPDEEIVDELERRDPIDLKALGDTFGGNRKDIEYYYGQSGFEPSRDSSYWAEALVKNHPDDAREYLNIRDTEFKPTELGMNAITDHLVEEHGMNRRIVEAVNDDYYKLLVLVFHAMYDPSSESLGREYEMMAAKTKIFENNKEQVYHHDEQFDVGEVRDSVTEHVREQNDGSTRGFAVKDYSDEDADEMVMKIFKESSRTGERVFRFRKAGREEPPAEPEIEYDSTHNIKTIGVRARNTPDGAEFTLSKSKSGWKNDLEGFFDSVFGIENAWETMEEERVTGATQVVQEVKETADDEEATKEDVVDRATEVVGDLSEQAIEEMDESDDVNDDEIEEVEQLYENITLIGIEVDQDDETDTVAFNIESGIEFEEWMSNIDQIDSAVKSLMARVEQENLKLIYEVGEEEGETEEFEVSDGTWAPKGRGMDLETIDHINRLLTTSHDDE